MSERVGMGPFGSNIKVATFVESGVPVISGQHLNQTLLEDKDFKFVTDDHARKLENSTVRRGDLVFTHAGNIGQVSYIPDSSAYDRYILSQRQFFLRPKPGSHRGRYLIYWFRSPAGQHRLLASASQVGVPSLARPVTFLRSITLLDPPSPLLESFEGLTDPIHTLIATKRKESEQLSTSRDVLLRKLLAGELVGEQ